VNPLIIAEGGISHGGSIERAFDLAEAAQSAGADIVKFQTYQTDKLLHRSDPDYDLLKKLELPFGAFKEISAYCGDLGIEFCSTPGDVECLDFLVRECGVKRIKIGSDDLTNKPFVSAAYATGLPIILSTGMATMEEINKALFGNFLMTNGSYKVTLLHCVSLYPCPMELVNLRAMEQMRKAFNLSIGYSDHTTTVDACVIAAALGASVIEKHMRLPDYDGVDSIISAHPSSFRWMVNKIKDVVSMLGDGRKEPSERERKASALLRKGPDGLRPIGPGGLYEDFGAHTGEGDVNENPI